MIDRILSRVLAVSASVLLLAGCTGDVYKVQAGMYDDYKERLDTASSYESVKKLNNELNMALVSYVKGNSEDVALYHKEAANHREGIKTLVKAETDYAKAYLNKVMGTIINGPIASLICPEIRCCALSVVADAMKQSTDKRIYL